MLFQSDAFSSLVVSPLQCVPSPLRSSPTAEDCNYAIAERAFRERSLLLDSRRAFRAAL